MARIRSLSDDLARERVGGLVALEGPGSGSRWRSFPPPGAPSRLLAHTQANGRLYIQPPLKLSFYRGLPQTAAGNRSVFLL
jgi:hypothetical protein